MEITGWDSVVFTVTPARAIPGRVMAATLARWPAAFVEGLGTPEGRTEPLADVPAERIPIDAAHLIFYRDAAMHRHMERVAYAPMEDGKGPFAVVTRVREDVEFEVTVTELHATDHRTQPGPPPDRYPAWLCATRVVEVTAVTPADPAGHPFSAWVLEQVRAACRAAG